MNKDSNPNAIIYDEEEKIDIAAYVRRHLVSNQAKATVGTNTLIMELVDKVPEVICVYLKCFLLQMMSKYLD